MQRPCVSLFTNCGAGDYGYRLAGFNFVVLAEILSKRLDVAKLNHPDAWGVLGDLRRTWPEVVDSYRRIAGREDPWLLSACPPCQGMSSANCRRGKEDDMNAGARDPRNLLVMPIIEVARSLSPRVIVVENVPAFLTRQIPHPETMYATTAAALLAEVLTENYAVFPFLCDLADFGIPQHRKRAFLTFVRRDLWGLQDFVRKRRAPYPKPSYCSKEGGMEHISVEDCLEALSLAKLDARNRRTASSADPLHTVPVWSKHHYSMVAAIPAGSGSSAWENEVCEICGTVNVREDDFKCPNCGNRLLRPVVQESDGSLRLVRGFRATSYRRMNPKTPAPAVTTANGTIGSSTTIHPDQNRVLSARECCHLQTIPDDFLWLKSGDDHIETHVVRKMIGEAVPPKFTELHGKAIRGILEEKHVLAPISVFDDRCETARRKMIKSQFPNLA